MNQFVDALGHLASKPVAHKDATPSITPARSKVVKRTRLLDGRPKCYIVQITVPNEALECVVDGVEYLRVRPQPVHDDEGKIVYVSTHLHGPKVHAQKGKKVTAYLEAWVKEMDDGTRYGYIDLHMTDKLERANVFYSAKRARPNAKRPDKLLETIPLGFTNPADVVLYVTARN